MNDVVHQNNKSELLNFSLHERYMRENLHPYSDYYAARFHCTAGNFIICWEETA